MNKNTEITLAWELYQAGLTKSAIARDLGRNRETIGVWLHETRIYGLKGFLERYESAKKGKRPGNSFASSIHPTKP